MARCLKVGINCLAVADHGTIEGAVKMKSLAPFPVIIGQEILTTQGEIMGLFLKEEVPRGLPAQEAAARVKAQGGLVCLPHPFDRVGRWRLPNSVIMALLPQVDIMEVFNSRTIFFWDSRYARRFAQAHKLLPSAGSDAHTTYEIGRAYVEMPEFSTPEEFKTALAQGKIVGRRSSPWVLANGLWTRLKRRFF